LARRAFDSRDRVAIVNRELAPRLWPNGNATGRRIRFGGVENATAAEIVGIARDGKHQQSMRTFDAHGLLASRSMAQMAGAAALSAFCSA
jgi:hypothetical protein